MELQLLLLFLQHCLRVTDLHRSYPEDGTEADETIMKRPKLDKAGSFDAGVNGAGAESGDYLEYFEACFAYWDKYNHNLIYNSQRTF